MAGDEGGVWNFDATLDGEQAWLVSICSFRICYSFIHLLLKIRGNLTEHRLVAFFILSFRSLWSSWILHPNRIADESIDGFLGRWLENLRLGMMLASMLKVWGWSDGIQTNGFPSISFPSLWSSRISHHKAHCEWKDWWTVYGWLESLRLDMMPAWLDLE